MIERSALIRMVARARDAIDREEPHGEMIAELESILPTGSDIANLCHSDYPAETIVDIAIGFPGTKRLLSRDELAEVVRQFYSGASSEAQSILLVETFEYNCQHPAGRDLLLDPDAYIADQSDPSPEAIADLAMLRAE